MAGNGGEHGVWAAAAAGAGAALYGVLKWALGKIPRHDRDIAVLKEQVRENERLRADMLNDFEAMSRRVGRLEESARQFWRDSPVGRDWR